MKRTILYVDDEPTNLVVFEAAFEDLFDIRIADSAKAALEILEREPIPVVVSDQRMPEMTGVEMFGVIRRQHPHVQRVILSGFSDSDAIIDAINTGQVFQFVRKPWQRVELQGILQRALDVHDMSLQNSVLTERLLQAERFALLGQATGRIAHEISNQLNILPLVELIEDEYSDDEQLQLLARVARSTYERLVELINEVKAFLRFETREFSLQPAPLADSIQELISFLRFNSDVPYDRLTVDLRANPVVLINKLKLHQVLVNLVRNAAHAIADNPEGRIDLALGVEGPNAVIRVADNGVGISPEVLPRIWDPLFTTKGTSGNGMGLDITRGLIEAHQGTVECESRPGAGATFTIRLPLPRSPLPPNEPGERGTSVPR